MSRMCIAASLRAARMSALCAALAAPSLGLAQFTARVVPGARTSATVEAVNPAVAFCRACPVAASQSGSFVNGGVLNRSDANGTAFADYGTLRVLASGSTSGPDAFAETDAQAAFSDAFTIDAAGLAGQHGTLMLTLETTSAHAISGEAFGLLSSSLRIDAGGGSAGTWVQAITFNADGSVRSSSSYPGIGAVPFSPTLLATIDFVFGESIGFTASLLARVRGGSGALGAPASFAVDASRSAYWGGILSIVDADGAAVADYATRSSSGIDWSRSFVPQAVAPVPEPETYALLMAGLIGLRFVARRRTSSILCGESRSTFPGDSPCLS